jgi:hypothetical protein
MEQSLPLKSEWSPRSKIAGRADRLTVPEAAFIGTEQPESDENIWMLSDVFRDHT